MKVRRIHSGGKRPDGHRRRTRIRRPDPTTIRRGTPDPNLTGVAGLVAFGSYARRLGVDDALHRSFDRLKAHRNVVYPTGAQLRLLTDLFAVGETRDRRRSDTPCPHFQLTRNDLVRFAEGTDSPLHRR